MKNPFFFAVLAILLLCLLVGSCGAIAAIFKAGMGFGIFILLIILLIIAAVILRPNKNR